MNGWFCVVVAVLSSLQSENSHVHNCGFSFLGGGNEGGSVGSIRILDDIEG